MSRTEPGRQAQTYKAEVGAHVKALGWRVGVWGLQGNCSVMNEGGQAGPGAGEEGRGRS